MTRFDVWTHDQGPNPTHLVVFGERFAVIDAARGVVDRGGRARVWEVAGDGEPELIFDSDAFAEARRHWMLAEAWARGPRRRPPAREGVRGEAPGVPRKVDVKRVGFRGGPAKPGPVVSAAARADGAGSANHARPRRSPNRRCRFSRSRLVRVPTPLPDRPGG